MSGDSETGTSLYPGQVVRQVGQCGSILIVTPDPAGRWIVQSVARSDGLYTVEPSAMPVVATSRD